MEARTRVTRRVRRSTSRRRASRSPPSPSFTRTRRPSPTAPPEGDPGRVGTPAPERRQHPEECRARGRVAVVRPVEEAGNATHGVLYPPSGSREPVTAYRSSRFGVRRALKKRGRGIRPTGTSIRTGRSRATASRTRSPTSVGSLARNPATPYASASRMKSGFARSAPDAPAPGLVEVARDVAVGVVVEHDDHHRDPVPDRGRQLLAVEEEAAVAAHHHDRPVRARHLGPERRGERVAEIAGVRRREVGPGLVDGPEGSGVVPDLGHVADQDGLGRRPGPEAPLDRRLGLLVVGRDRCRPDGLPLRAARGRGAARPRGRARPGAPGSPGRRRPGRACARGCGRSPPGPRRSGSPAAPAEGPRWPGACPPRGRGRPGPGGGARASRARARRPGRGRSRRSARPCPRGS